MIKNVLLFLILFALLNIPAFTQQTLTLDECINVAIQNNYDILLTQHQIKYDEIQTNSALGSYFPTIYANAGFSHSFGGPTSYQLQMNQLSAQIAANLLIYDGGSREANYSRAELLLELTLLQKEFLTQQIKLAVFSQYINIKRLEEIIKMRTEDLSVSNAQLENFQARLDAGIIPIEVVLSQEAEVGNKEIQLLYDEIEYNKAKQDLLITMGRNPTANVTFADNTIPSYIPDSELDFFKARTGTLNNSLESALVNRKDYASYQKSQNIAQKSISASKGNYLPSLSANFQYGLYGWEKFTNDNLQGSVSLNLSVPIFSNYTTDLQVQQSILQYERENSNLSKLEQSILSEVQTAYFNLESAEKAIKI